MAGADDTAGPSTSVPPKVNGDKDEESDAGSEDLEAESSGSEDEEIEEDEGEGEGEGDEDMEMAEDGDPAASSTTGKEQALDQQSHGEVMVH